MLYLIIFVSSVIVLGLIVAFLMLEVDSPSSSRTVPRRACPLCGTDLGQEGRLFADEVTHPNGPTELKIKGCTYCYEEANDIK